MYALCAWSFLSAKIVTACDGLTGAISVLLGRSSNATWKCVNAASLQLLIFYSCFFFSFSLLLSCCACSMCVMCMCVMCARAVVRTEEKQRNRSFLVQRRQAVAGTGVFLSLLLYACAGTTATPSERSVCRCASKADNGRLDRLCVFACMCVNV